MCIRDRYIFILKGANTEGIVHQYTNLFSKNRINILDMDGRLKLTFPSDSSTSIIMIGEFMGKN